MRTRTLLLTGILLAVFYAVTAARNRTEAEDAFDFAWAVERVEGRAQLHPHHLAYIPVMKALHGAVTRLTGPVRAHPVMAGAGAVSAAACVVLLAGLLAGPLGAGRRRAWAAAAGLAVSYGFWRYAAEAEVYAPMLLLVLGAWTMAARAQRPSGAALSGALGGAAVLLHVFAAIPALGAIPLWLWMRRGWRPALTHGAVAALLAAGVYAWAGLSPLRTIGDAPSGDLLRREGGASAASFVRAGVGLGQALVSGNFLFAQPRFAAAMQARYPARMLEEEVFMGRAARPWMRIVPWATLIALIASILAVAVGGMRSRPVDFQALETGDGEASKDWKPALAAAAAWFVAHAALLLWKEPGNPELWIAALPALWIVVATSLAAVRAGPAPVLVLSAALAAHNWAGGLAFLRDPAGDYNAAKAAAVLAEAHAGDRVITAGGPVFFRYLRYHCAAEIVDAWAETEASFKFQVPSFKGEAGSSASSPPPSTLHPPPSQRCQVSGVREEEGEGGSSKFQVPSPKGGSRSPASSPPPSTLHPPPSQRCQVSGVRAEGEEGSRFQASSFKGEARSSASSLPPSTLHLPPSALRPPSPSRLLVLGDLFDPPASLQKRFPEAADSLRTYAGSVRVTAKKMRDDAFGGVLLVEDSALPGRAPGVE